jgi:hypothetical protein
MAAIPTHSGGVEEGFGVCEVEESSPAVAAAVRRASPSAAPKARPSHPRSLFDEILNGESLRRFDAVADLRNVGECFGDTDGGAGWADDGCELSWTRNSHLLGSLA